MVKFLMLCMIMVGRYAVVVSNSTYNDSLWRAVVDTLVQKYNASVFIYYSNINELLDTLREYKPTHIAFVCKVEETPPSFVQQVWTFSRSLDEDPYGDAIWGIVTGCDALDALKIVSGPREMEIKTVLGGTACCDLRFYPQGIATSEVDYGKYWIKYPDSITPEEHTDGPTDRTEWLVKMLNGDSLIFGDSVDIFYTSGHGNYNVWQLHYPSPGLEGYFRSDDYGHLYGDPYSGPNIDIISANPKIYFALGNCNVGQIWGTHCMVPAWIHSANAYLVTAYVIGEGPYSYQHGATKAYFCRQDHYSWPEAFYLGNCCFVFDLNNGTPGIGNPPDLNGSGLYGDPGLEARIPEGPDYVYDTLLYTKELIVKPGQDRDTITFKIIMNRTGKPGYTGKWGYRNPIVLFPWWVDEGVILDSIEIIDMNAYSAVVTDNFALLYVWYQGQPDLQKGEERWGYICCKEDLYESGGAQSCLFSLYKSYKNLRWIPTTC